MLYILQIKLTVLLSWLSPDFLFFFCPACIKICIALAHPLPIGRQSVIKMSKAADVELNGHPEVLQRTVQELSDIELVEGKRSKKGLLLRPQPSNNPNDPLVCASPTYPLPKD